MWSCYPGCHVPLDVPLPPHLSGLIVMEGLMTTKGLQIHVCMMDSAARRGHFSACLPCYLESGGVATDSCVMKTDGAQCRQVAV